MDWAYIYEDEKRLFKAAGVQLETYADYDIDLERAEDIILTSTAWDDVRPRKDLTHMESFAIDDAETLEVDDAFSYKVETQQVYIHITDFVRHFRGNKDHPLVKKALQRSHTMYLRNQHKTALTCFSRRLIKNLLSLDSGEGEIKSAITFEFHIGPSGDMDRTEGWGVYFSEIKRPRQMTHAEADEILVSASEKDEEFLSPDEIMFTELKKVISRLHGFRSARRDEMVNEKFRQRNMKNVEMYTRRKDMNMKGIVQELMLHAGQVAGLFAQRHGVPMLYRGQDICGLDAFKEILRRRPKNVDYVRKQIAQMCHTTPPAYYLGKMPYYTEGFTCHVQVTAPMRCAFDIMAHFQIMGKLLNDSPPYNRSQLQTALRLQSGISKKVKNCQKSIDKYKAWKKKNAGRISSASDISERLSFVRDGEIIPLVRGLYISTSDERELQEKGQLEQRKKRQFENRKSLNATKTAYRPRKTRVTAGNGIGNGYPPRF